MTRSSFDYDELCETLLKASELTGSRWLSPTRYNDLARENGWHYRTRAGRWYCIGENTRPHSSFEDAVKDAGLAVVPGRGRTQAWLPTEISSRWETAIDELGRPSRLGMTIYDRFVRSADEDYPLSWKVAQHYGSWAAACEAVGITANQVAKWDETDHLAAYRRITDLAGQETVTLREAIRLYQPDREPHPEVSARAFGRWSALQTAATAN